MALVIETVGDSLYFDSFVRACLADGGLAYPCADISIVTGALLAVTLVARLPGKPHTDRRFSFEFHTNDISFTGSN